VRGRPGAHVPVGSPGALLPLPAASADGPRALGIFSVVTWAAALNLS
jgi:hypothetical protein